MPLQTIIHANGPLPLTETFTPQADGPVVLIVTGTAWTTSPPGKIGYAVSLNGTVIGSATMFANINADHMTLPTLFVNVVIPSNQPQKIAITAVGNTVTDLNDNFVVQLML
jgi:hypothetical protein